MIVLYNVDKKRYEARPAAESWKEDVEQLKNCGWRFDGEVKTWHTDSYLNVEPLNEYLGDVSTAIQVAIDAQKAAKKTRKRKQKASRVFHNDAPEPEKVPVKKHVCAACKTKWACQATICKEPTETICSKCPCGLPACFLMPAKQ